MRLEELPQHHAVLITHSDRTGLGTSLWEELSASPANRFFNQTVLDIETSRAIISWAQSPYSGERTALISFHTAGLPAQNAMLKILEEPKENIRFILLTTHKNNLIDTVLSRVRHIHAEDEGKEIERAMEFLSTDVSSRMKLPFIVELLGSVDDEGRKDRESVKEFILSLSEALKENKGNPSYILETIQVASYASDPSASGKALLEYLALLLPQTK